MIKSFRGDSLVELDKEVNIFLEKYPKAKVIHFQAVDAARSVSKLIYIYIVEFERDTVCCMEDIEFQKMYGL